MGNFGKRTLLQRFAHFQFLSSRTQLKVSNCWGVKMLQKTYYCTLKCSIWLSIAVFFDSGVYWSERFKSKGSQTSCDRLRQGLVALSRLHHRERSNRQPLHNDPRSRSHGELNSLFYSWDLKFWTSSPFSSQVLTFALQTLNIILKSEGGVVINNPMVQYLLTR